MMSPKVFVKTYIGEVSMSIGNGDTVRDFLHVRDVVAAYLALLEQGAAGDAYNVSSGEGITPIDPRLSSMLVLDASGASIGVTPAPTTCTLQAAVTPNEPLASGSSLRVSRSWRRTCGSGASRSIWCFATVR